MKDLNGFPTESIEDFYCHVISQRPIKNYYLQGIFVIKADRKTPKWRMTADDGEVLPDTRAGACGWMSILERIYFRVWYRNINYQKNFSKRGLYYRGLCSNASRTGGFRLKWRRAK